MFRQQIVTIFVLIFIFGACLPAINGAKILAIFPYPQITEYILSTPYIRALNDRGHELTVIQAYRQYEIIENVRYISVSENNVEYADFLEQEYQMPLTKWEEFNVIKDYCVEISVNVLKTAEVQALLRSNATFDLIIIEPIQTEALYGFALYYNAPLLGLSLVGPDWNTDYLVGYISPSIYEPILPLGYMRNLNLWDRLQNLITISEEWLLMNLILLPKHEEIFKIYFPDYIDSFSELRHNFSLMLVNQHFSLGHSRPNVPSVIEVAGLHIPEKLPPLPADLLRFIDEAPYGVIYFSLGTEVMCSRLPKGTLDILHNTFELLHLRVIWKCNISPSNNKSSNTRNIYFSDWLPQMGILEHPNVKLFITQGGRLSLIESAYYGVPVIGLPHFYDQFTNVDRITEMGVGISLDINKLSEKSLNNAINTILKDRSYTRNALSLSQRFRDQPISPINNAVYWTEYILKYKGAPHMKVAVKDFKLLDYYNVDRSLVLLLRFGLTALVVLLLGWNFKSYMCKSRHVGIQVRTG